MPLMGVPTSMPKVFACNRCRIARGRCRQRGAPGHLPKLEAGLKIMFHRKRPRAASAGSAAAAEPGARSSAPVAVAAAALLESCRECKLRKGYCYRPGMPGHLEESLSLSTMPRGKPRGKYKKKGAANGKKVKAIRVVHPVEVAGMERRRTGYANVEHWPDSYDLAANSMTSWSRRSDEDEAPVADGAARRDGFVFAPFL